MATARKYISFPEAELSEKTQQALASLAIEGIILPPDSLADIALLDSGKMSKEEFLKKTLQMAKHK